MSYEGYREFLCTRGHHSRVGCWDDDPTTCAFCKAPIAYRNSVDLTNGQDESEPWSMPGPKTEIGHDDDWRADHHGNRYAIKVRKYEPGVERWRKIS